LLGILGLWFVARRSGWTHSNRAAFYLSGWVALAIGAELCATHPTFPSYFVLMTPFLAIPAAAGLYLIAAQIRSRLRDWWLVPVLALLLALGLAKSLRDDQDRLAWADMEALARKVDQVTAPHGTLWADEQVYFLTRRPPADGTEFSYAEVIDLPENVALPLHIVSDEALDRQAAEGKFSTVSTCEDPDVIEHLKLASLFRRQADAGRRCKVFWEPTNSPR
jgi:hypothetical protein